MGRMYGGASLAKCPRPSCAISIISPAVYTAFRPKLSAERTRRAQCLSRSGVTPSKARAPSTTTEAIQAAWVIGPMIGGLPSSHLPSRNGTAFAVVWSILYLAGWEPVGEVVSGVRGNLAG